MCARVTPVVAREWLIEVEMHPAKLLEAFMDRILVDCPRCAGLAIIRLLDTGAGFTNVLHGPRRMICTRCPAMIDQPYQALSRPHMGLMPRLVLSTRNGDLVCYNEDHLDYLESYLAGKLRAERVEEGGVRNRSVISRLPAWAKSAKNRDEIVAGLRRLRETRLT